MESQPINPEFRNNPENFHPCLYNSGYGKTGIFCCTNFVNHIKLYSKTCVKWPLSKRPKIVFQDQLLLNAGQKYCRSSKGSILQYFRPSISYHLSLRSLFFLFLSGRLRQVFQ